MRIESAIFGNDAPYQRLARVLLVSADENSPATPASVTQFDARDPEIMRYPRRPTLLANSRKTKHHRELVREAADGEVLCLIDADTMVLGDLSEVEAMDFDLAVTIRAPGADFRINSGVVFVRVSPRMRAFYDRWLAVNLDMLARPAFYHQWKDRYGGINQSSLGYLLERERADLNVVELPGAVWNATREAWPLVGPHTKVVHVLGTLRVACLHPHGRTADQTLVPLRDRWLAFDATANQLAAAGGSP